MTIDLIVSPHTRNRKGDSYEAQRQGAGPDLGADLGGAVCFATLWLIGFGYEGTVIRHLDHFYFGYSFSVVGAFIGLVYGFIDGAIGGAIFAWLYNKLAG